MLRVTTSHVLRTLRKTPTFTIGAITTVALAVAATTSIFSVVYGVLLRQLPYKDVDRAYWIWSDQPGRDRTPFTVPDFIDYRRSTTTLSGFAGYSAYSANLSDEAAAERVQGLRATGNFFEVLGAHARVGRLIERDDERPGFDHVAVLSQPFWIRRFAADQGIVGQSIRLNSEPFRVIGVLAEGFATPVKDVDFVVPFSPDSDPRRGARNSVSFIHAVGRLTPNASLARAVDEMNAIARRLQEQYPVENARKRGVRLVGILDGVAGSFRTALLMLFGSVGALLLIACANLGNLMLARASDRRKDLAVQLALGASRGAVVRQVLLEALLLAAAGGVLGVVLMRWIVTVIVAAAPAALPRVAEIRVDVAVLVFAIALSSTTGVLFGVLPALASGGVDLREALQGSARGTSASGRHTRGLLVSVEVMLAIVLLVLVTMLTKSFANVQRVAPGFDTSHVLSARLTLPAKRYDTRQSIIGFQRAVATRVSSLPTVTQVGAISLLPLSGLMSRVPFTVDGRPIEREHVPLAQFRIVTPGYFEAVGIPLRRGRSFAESDAPTARPVAIINEELAHQWLRGLDPVGSRLLIDDNNQGARPVDIVGIVGDVQQLALDGGPTWDIYLPYAQMHADTVGLAAANMFWVARTIPDPMTVGEDFSREVHRLDPEIVASQIRPMGGYLSDAVAPRRFSLSLMAVFAGAALVLALTGIYAVVAYSIRQRTREIGIRMALGATSANVLTLVVGDGMRFVAAGIAVGVIVAAATARVVSTMLFGVGPADVATLGEVAAFVATASLCACALATTSVSRSPGAVLNDG